MQYRYVPSSGDKISILGYGGMRFPQKNGKIDEAKAISQLRYSIDRGLNYIDTAYFYHGGQSEPLIGKALKEGYRERVFVATKLPPWSLKTKSDMQIIFDDQIKKLMVDYIDYYLLHAVNAESWEKFLSLDAVGFLIGLKQRGLIRNIGFSFHGDKELFKKVIDFYKWDFCQIQYNILDEYNQAGKEGLEYAAKKGVAVFVMEPLRGGSLVNNIPMDIASLYTSFREPRPPVEWALKWIWNHPEVTMLLSGMTEDKHIEDNLTYAKDSFPNMLDEDELSLINSVKEKYKSKMKIPCTGCQYCMPCPFGVDIPRCFDLYNSIFLLNQKRMKGFYWMQLAGAIGKPSHASLCTDCGKCIKLCPQSIQIPKELKEVKKYMETPLMKPSIWILKKFLELQKAIAKIKGKNM